MKSFLFICFFFISLSVFSQNTFLKNYSRNGPDDPLCIYTSDKGFLLYDTEWSGAVLKQIMLKTDSLGNVMWGKRLQLSNSGSDGFIIQTNDNGYFITSSGWNNPYGLIFVKTDSVGDTLWTKVMMNGAGESNTVYNIMQTSDSNYLISSHVNWHNGQYDFIIKLDPNGNCVWANYLYDRVTSTKIVESNDGNYVVCGRSILNFNEIFLLKLDTSGNLIWCHVYKNSNSDSYFYILLEETNDNGFALTGSGGSMASSVILKTDSAGNLLWNRNISHTDIDAVHENSNGELIVGGEKWFLRMDSLGDTLSAKTYLNQPFQSCTFLPAGDEVVFYGPTKFIHPPDSIDIYFYKTDTLGSNLCYTEVPTILDTIITSFTDSMLSIPVSIQIPNVINLPTIISVTNENFIASNGCLLNSADEIKLEKPFSVFPNPSNNSTLNLSRYFKNATFEIYDLTGRVIYSEILEFTNQVTISSLLSGTYIIRIITPEEVHSTTIVYVSE